MLDEVEVAVAQQGQTYCNVQSTAASQSVLDWFPVYKSCESYFLSHAQASLYVQALCTFMNIRLPYQKIPIFPPTPSSSSFPWLPPPENLYFPPSGNTNLLQPVSLIPYIRRLICTGYDTDLNLEKFFGTNWSSGIGTIHGKERRNYLNAAKSESWLNAKLVYDIGSEETVPFLVPLRGATEKEIIDAEREWGEWLAMQDWMVGPRRPPSLDALMNVESTINSSVMDDG